MQPTEDVPRISLCRHGGAYRGRDFQYCKRMKDNGRPSVLLRRSALLIRRCEMANPRLVLIAQDIEQVADELKREGK